MSIHVPPLTLWGHWSADPTILTFLAIVAGLYLWGSNRGAVQDRSVRAVTRGQRLSFWSALALVLIVLASPFGEMATILFSGHMIQHMLLVLVAAPLFVQSSPGRVLARSLSPRLLAWAQRVMNFPAVARVLAALENPLLACLLYAMVLWVPSLPSVYVATQEHRSFHAVAHLLLLGAAVLFWRAILKRDNKSGKRVGVGASIGLVLVTAFQNSVLGAIIAFASMPWYPQHVAGALVWGIAPLDDQQLAGLVIWIPSAAVFTITAGVLFLAWLNVVEREVRDRERQARLTYQPPRPFISDNGTTKLLAQPSVKSYFEVTQSGD